MYLNALVFTASLSPSNSWRAADEWGKQEEIKEEIFESGFQGHLYWLGLRAHLPPSLPGAPEAPQSFHLFTHTSTRDASSEGLPCLRLLGGSGMQTSSILEPSSTAPHRLHSQGLGPTLLGSQLSSSSSYFQNPHLSESMGLWVLLNRPRGTELLLTPLGPLGQWAGHRAQRGGAMPIIEKNKCKLLPRSISLP